MRKKDHNLWLFSGREMKVVYLLGLAIGFSSGSILGFVIGRSFGL